MSAGVAEFYIEQGATFRNVITLLNPDQSPINLTGYTARGKIKASAKSSTVLATFNCTIDNPVDGEIIVELDAEQTSSITTTGCRYNDFDRYYYDIEIEYLGVVTRILNGVCKVSPEVTK